MNLLADMVAHTTFILIRVKNMRVQSLLNCVDYWRLERLGLVPTILIVMVRWNVLNGHWSV